MTTRRILALGLLMALPCAIATRSALAGDDPPAAKTAKPEAEPAAPEVTDAAALDDDILAVISLPLAADDARDAGVDPVEVQAAIDAVDAAGGSPADASEVLGAEAEATRKRGAKPGFGWWVRAQVAAGKRGKELADLIKKKKAEYKEMSDEERAEVDAKLAKLKETWIEHRKQLHERRKELVAKGKKAKAKGQAELAKLEKLIAKNEKRKQRLDEAAASDPARKEKLEKILAKAEKREDKLEDKADKLEDKADKLEDKADKLEDKADKREDKADKREDKADKGKGKSEGKADEAKHEGKHG
ncbi:MAG TPA: hypothetical protein VG755_24475 [Nannocystaceae bacterium]|nr:hypothetical protein [Nannocystaceae bacterium]